MDLSFNTSNVDVSIALKALRYYRAKEFGQAIEALLEVLDVEPRNWDARLMLGSCYYKTGQFGSAHRVFKMIHDRCLEPQLKQKAIDGMQAAERKLQKGTKELPLEFGEMMPDHNAPQKIVAWLD